MVKKEPPKHTSKPKGELVPVTQKRFRITRDAAILSFAIGAATFEITLGGARPSVLTFLTGVFLSPLIIRADERNNDK